MSSARGGERGRAKPTRSRPSYTRGGAHNSNRNGSGNASDSDGGGGHSFRGGRGRGASRGSSTRGAPTGPRQKQTFGGPQARRSSNSTSQTNSFQPASTAGLPWPQRYETLKSNRALERKHAIANGLIQDPDKPRRLEDAITIVGTCPDMCAEYERVERVVQKDVWEMELEPGTKEPSEARMIKKFRRAAAGLEEQLPSDLRPPSTLSKTCDYLFNVILSEHELAKAHKFLWDRTRAVRNDFTIQQCTKTPDIRIQIDCFERIARFHILSLHQMALPKEDVPTSYDRHQDREQLDKTLLTLITLYDENRDRYRSPNESEFRAYSILFQMEAIVPDIEDRLQSWPAEIVRNPRVQTALKIYTTATDTSQDLGPLNPRISHPIAQSNAGKFFNIVKSNQVSYLMACVAELVFNMVRRSMLNNIWNAYRIGGDRKVEDWSLEEIARVMHFDDYEEAREFCESYNFSILEKEDGTEFIDLTSVPGKILPSANPNLRKQFRSEMVVEAKRFNRSYSAIVSGLTVKQAKERGMIEEPEVNGAQPSLFVNQDSESDTEAMSTPGSSFGQPVNPFAAAAAAAAPKNPFAQPATGFGAPAAPSAFGQPTNSTPSTGFGVFGTPSSQGSTQSTPNSFAHNPFSPLSAASTPATIAPSSSATSSPFQQGPFSSAPSPFAKPASPAATANTQPSPFQLGAQQAPFSAFGQPAQAQKSTTPISSFEEPSDTPPGSPPKPATFPRPTSSVPTTTPTLFPPATASTEQGKQPQPAQSSVFGFPSATSSSEATKENQPPSSIFGFPPVATKSSTPATTATAAPSGTPFPSFTPTAAKSDENKNPFGFTASQVSGTSPTNFSLKPAQGPASSVLAADHTPTSATASPFPTTTPSASLDLGPQAPKPSLGAFNPSKFSTPPSTIGPATNSSPFSIGNNTSTSTVDATTTQSSQPPSFTPASTLTSTPPSFTPSSSLAPVPPAAQAPKAPPPQPQPDALAIAREKAQKERLRGLAVDRITENLVMQPKVGLLAQFVEHMAHNVIMDAMMEFEDEQNQKVADQFRVRSLTFKYGQKWRNIWRSEKVRRRGRERRKARRDALNAAASRRGPAGIETDVQEFKSTMGASMRRLAASAGSRGSGHFRDSFSSSIGVHDILERDMRRPTSSQNQSYLMSGALPSNDSRRSSMQSDLLGPDRDGFRISKSRKAPMQPPQLIRHRARFLSGDPLIPKESSYTGRISTTQTDYFRLRAMGIKYEDVHGGRKGRKRYREFDDDEEAIVSDDDGESVTPPERKRRIAMGTRDYRLSQSRTPTGENRYAETVTSAPSTINKEHDDEEALRDPTIAKARALQKSMSESIDYYRNIREQIEKERSESVQASTTNPLAQSYSSFRASIFPEARPAPPDLPKYWSRESKFLPRSEYGGARWLANAQKGKERAVEPSTNAKPSKPNFDQQVPSSQPVNRARTTSQSFNSMVPDSNPFISTQSSKRPTPNGMGTQGDEIMILSSDDEDDVKENKIRVKREETPANLDDDDDVMEVTQVGGSQSFTGDFETQYGQPDAFDSQFEEQYQYAQGLETTEMDEDEVDPALLDEDDGDDEVEGDDEGGDDVDVEDDEEDEEDEEEEEEEDEEDDDIIEDDDDVSEEEETESDEDSEERGVTPSGKYKDKGNSFDDAIEL
ncbi:SAC3 family protein 1 [Lasiodiplodia theobromae]|uniref:SAC3 family protein 1 n=1 Tax=Lasiodiplodia theobromae TaxID=45133 RepID=A0A5N5DGS5_9PEZI|nr:SAC3 family protein 1 [Lasiodiplodia theobromae]